MNDYCYYLDIVLFFFYLDIFFIFLSDINHHGAMNGGHYTSNINFNNHWYHISDHETKEIMDPQSDSTYILFYRLSN